MGMGRKIRAVAGGFPLNIDLLHQTAADQGFQTVVDSGHRDSGHLRLGPGVHLIGRWMIPLVQENAEHRLPLGGSSLTEMIQSIAQSTPIHLFQAIHQPINIV
jgi:uncharacterized protein YvpB